MARPSSTLRNLITLALLGAVAIVCAMAGNWQLRRAAERDATLQAIEAEGKSAPVELTAQTPASDLVQWRAATARGVWLHDFTVLLDNRNFKGRPGYWVATPLLLDAGAQTALLVLRGWLPRPIGPGEVLPALPRPADEQAVAGRMVDHVPRMFELWSLRGHGDANSLAAQLREQPDHALTVQNLALDDLAAATGLTLLPVVLEQETGSDQAFAGVFVRDWPRPSTDSATNRGYALQWFSFAAIAGVAWLVFAWRTLRRRGHARS